MLVLGTGQWTSCGNCPEVGWPLELALGRLHGHSGEDSFCAHVHMVGHIAFGSGAASAPPGKRWHMRHSPVARLSTTLACQRCAIWGISGSGRRSMASCRGGWPSKGLMSLGHSLVAWACALPRRGPAQYCQLQCRREGQWHFAQHPKRCHCQSPDRRNCQRVPSHRQAHLQSI